MDEKEMITIPFNIFVDGVQAGATLRAISAMIVNGDVYCSDSIKTMLGIPVNKDTTGTKNEDV